MDFIQPKVVLFIKLGEKGKWEYDCIERDQNMRLGFNEADHKECMRGNWKAIRNFYLNELKYDPKTATSFAHQIEFFYKSDETVLWITFYANKFWWCFSSPEISLNKDGTKTRPVKDRWCDTDIFGKTLTTDNLRGTLLKTRRFQGTICKVKDANYAISKINGKISPEVIETRKILEVMMEKVSILIKNLNPKDFEILIDLIFRQAGWQRLGTVGKTEKTLDLDLLSPVTGEKAMVQIKSESDLQEFKEYCREFESMKEYNKFFYVVHTPANNLERAEVPPKYKLLLLKDIAKLTINSGLIEWVINKY